MKDIAVQDRKGFFAIALLLTASLSWSQTPPQSDPYKKCKGDPDDNGSIFLKTQADVDALGAQGCAVIAGKLAIDFSTITNLDGLGSITTIWEDLRIVANDRLTNIDGLYNLRWVGDGVRIEDNDRLTNLDGLASLYRSGSMFIKSNPWLGNLDGLAKLKKVWGFLVIEYNGSLRDCEGIALLLGWPNGPPDDSVTSTISISRNAYGCSSIAQVLASYTPPNPNDRFNELLETVQKFRGAGNSQQ